VEEIGFHRRNSEKPESRCYCSFQIRSQAERKDKAGLIIKEKLESFGIEVSDYITISDEVEKLPVRIKNYRRMGLK
jgi:molybdopterin biosynthesis enzyme MoaB